MQASHERAQALVDFAFDQQQQHGQEKQVEREHKHNNKQGLFVDQELEGIKGAELHCVQAGQPIGAGPVIQFTVNDKLVKVDDPAEDKDGEKFVVVEACLHTGLVHDSELAGNKVIGTGHEQEKLNKQGPVLISGLVFFFFFFLQPLDSRLRLKNCSHDRNTREQCDSLACFVV